VVKIYHYILIAILLLAVLLLPGCPSLPTTTPSITSLTTSITQTPTPTLSVSVSSALPSISITQSQKTTIPPTTFPKPTPVPTATPKSDNPTLRSLANALGKDFGTIITARAMNNNIYMDTISKQFNLIVLGNGMYMSVIQPQKGAWNFIQADNMVNYAVANNCKIRGHTLVWGDPDGGKLGSGFNSTPAWVYNGNYSRDDMIKIMYDNMTTIINRYGEWVKEWVVVNESASWDKAGGFANNIWKVRIGDDYIKLAFKKAKELAPDATLILNEWGGDYTGQTNWGREDNIYNHVKRLIEDGVPIDAIGLEFHLTAPSEPGEYDPTVDKILANFDRYTKLGLKVFITELDVRIKEPITPDKIAIQTRDYSTVVEAVLKSNSCSSISVWDYTDLYSWITETFPGYSSACLFDKHLKPKPVYDSVIEVMKKYASNVSNYTPPILVPTPTSTAIKDIPFKTNPPFLTQYGTIDPDVIYGNVGGVDLRMDIWQPKQPASKKPVIVYIHGGGFGFGDKSETAVSTMAAHWLGRGYLVASINYRLTPDFIFPSQIEDAKTAIRFLRANAAKYGINPDKIGVCGGSAGGYLVNMLGLCDSSAGFDNSGGYLNQSSRVQAVVDLFGIGDIVYQYEKSSYEGSNGPVSKFAGGADKFYQIASKANPLTYVSQDDPPFLIMHGDKDVEVLPYESQELYDKLVSAKVPTTLVWVKNAEHGFAAVGQAAQTPDMLERNTMIADFFDKYLK
jgi:GH35 family endo-1,4-beta-xylanase/acetyl esterase/lipase